jgi:hypothetical protein
VLPNFGPMAEVAKVAGKALSGAFFHAIIMHKTRITDNENDTKLSIF